MECPFCAEDFNDTARVCKSCGRDLRLVLPIIEENQELIRKAGELQLRVNRLRAAEARQAMPLQFWALHFGVYLLVPIVLLLIAHYVITIMFDVPLLYLRLGSFAIPLPFGFVLLMFSHHGFRWSALYGAVVGAVSVAGMLTIVGFADNIAILPENTREWREVFEYAASIMLAYVTGNVLAALAQRMVPKTLDASSAPSPAVLHSVRIVGGPAGSQTLRRRAQKISDNLGTVGTALGALGTAGASIFAGLRALLGDGS
jgi:hypothetical protein